MKAITIIGCCCIVVAGAMLLNLESSVANASKSGAPVPGTPYSEIYRGSLLNLTQSQDLYMSLEELRESSEVPVYAAASKTCSRTCSKKCSNSCTTTRGCSSRCKTYTEGCSGGGSTPGGGGSSPAGLVSEGYFIPRSADHAIGIQDFQRLLIIAGYEVKDSGKMDENTKSAISDFQSKNSLPTTGAIDCTTWHTLCLAVENSCK